MKSCIQKKGKRSAKLGEETALAVPDEEYEDTTIPEVEGIEQMDLFNLNDPATVTE